MRTRIAGFILASSMGCAAAIEPTLSRMETAVNSLAKAYTAALIMTECEHVSLLPEGQARVAWQLYNEIFEAVRERYPNVDYRAVWRHAAEQANNNPPYLALCYQMPQTLVGIYVAVFLRNPAVKMIPGTLIYE